MKPDATNHVSADRNVSAGFGRVASVGSGFSWTYTDRLLAVLTVAVLTATLSARQTTRQLDVPFFPTPENIVEAMLQLAKVTPADLLYDLGSGDGRIPIIAAQKYGARGVGIDIDANRIRDANDRLSKSGVGARVRFLQQDLFDAAIGEATVVTIYLLPRVNLRLMPKLKRELKPGTRVVSFRWDMGEEWPPDKSEEINGLMIHLWTIR